MNNLVAKIVCLPTLILLFTVGAIAPAPAQDKPTSKAKKQFTPPVILPSKNPLLAKDIACAKDLVKAIEMEGLEQRKLAADLVKFGCVRVVEGTFYVNITSVVPYKILGKPSSLDAVHLINVIGGGAEDGWVIGLDVKALNSVEDAIRLILKDDANPN